MSVLIRVPLPPRALTPNGTFGMNKRWDFAVIREYRETCRKAAEGLEIPAGKLEMSLTFCIQGSRVPRSKCPHKHRKPRAGSKPKSCRLCPYGPHDESNALAAFKAGQDGIFDAIGRRDSRRNLTIGGIRIDSTRGPWVEVWIREASEAVEAAQQLAFGGTA